MTADAPRFTLQDELPETPAVYPLEQVIQTYTLGAMWAIDAWYRAHKESPEVLIAHPVPPEVAGPYGPVLPMLTYNLARYPTSVLEVIKADRALRAIKAQPRDANRPRAISTRHTTLAYLLHQALDIDFSVGDPNTD